MTHLSLLSHTNPTYLTESQSIMGMVIRVSMATTGIVSPNLSGKEDNFEIRFYLLVELGSLC